MFCNGNCTKPVAIQNIKQQIELGVLREDLYYRLGVVPIEMPDLKNHTQDIPDLVKYYMSSSSAVLNKPIRILSDDAIASLQRYNWPGNLNELRNIIDWLLIMVPDTSDGIISSDMLPPEINYVSIDDNLNSINQFLSLRFLIKSFTETSENVARIPESILPLTEYL